jgi:hypothetical protein
MRRVRFVVLLPFFLVAEAILWSAASLASHVGVHHPSETLLKHRQLLNWLSGRNCKDIQKWGPDGHRL